MFSDICFFQSKHFKISMYPSLDYISNVIKESVVQTSSLRGLRQLSIIRREEGKIKHTIVIYNYRYTDSTESFGVCLVFNDYYPCGINYFFSVTGKVIADIVNEGKVLYIDNRGVIQWSNYDLASFSALLKQHIDRFKKDFNTKKANLKKLSSLSANYYNIYKKQTIVHQLSDTSWNVTESLNYNNIVIFTEEIEDENINSMRSLIKKSNDTVDDLNKQIAKLKEQLKQAEREKTKVNPPQKTEVKENETSDTTMWIVLGIIAAIILFNLTVPWFIPTVWPKLAVILTSFGTYFVFKALGDDSHKKIYEILGWSGAIAILLSTVLTIYGLFGGFSVAEDSEEKTDVSITSDKVRKDSMSLNSNSIKEQDSEKRITTDPKENSIPVVRQSIPKDFVLVPAGILKNESEWNNDKEVFYNVDIDSFYVCTFELTQAEYKRIIGSILPENYTWNIQIDYKDAKVVQQGDSIPVICTYQEFAEYCNKRSRLEGYDGFYDIEGNKVKIRHNGNGYRLLNHFEWTYAAKGGNSNERYSYAGSNKIGEVAWYGGNSKYRPHEVGKKKPNSLGIYDMSGNVSEMLLDDPKSPYRLIGGEGFEYWVNLGPNDILGMFEKNCRNGTRVAFVPRGMKNNNTKLTWKYKW